MKRSKETLLFSPNDSKIKQNTKTEKFFIEELLKFKGYCDDDIKTHLSFVPYPEQEIFNNYLHKVSFNDYRIAGDNIELFVGQIPNCFSDEKIIWILETVTCKPLIINYCPGRELSHKLLNCGFITIPRVNLEELLRCDKSILPDKNGIWLANNEYGLKIFKELGQEIINDPELGKKLDVEYRFHGHYSPNSIVIELSKSQIRANSSIIPKSSRRSRNSRSYNALNQYYQETTIDVPMSFPITPNEQLQSVYNQFYALQTELQSLSEVIPHNPHFQAIFSLSDQLLHQIMLLESQPFSYEPIAETTPKSGQPSIRRNNPYATWLGLTSS